MTAGPDAEGEHILARERRSFGYAFAGIRHAWRTQPHLRMQSGIALLAAVLGLVLRLSPPEWAVLLGAATLVLVLELVNTVVEAVVDLASPAYHPLARIAKDVAAGAVLVAAVGSVAIGLALFGPRLVALLR